MKAVRHEPTPEERNEFAKELVELADRPDGLFFARNDREWRDLLNIRHGGGLKKALAVVDQLSKTHFYKLKPFTKTERRHYARVGTKGRRGARRIRANCDCMDSKWENL